MFQTHSSHFNNIEDSFIFSANQERSREVRQSESFILLTASFIVYNTSTGPKDLTTVNNFPFLVGLLKDECHLPLVTSATRIFASLFYGFRLADVAKGRCHLAKRSPTGKGKFYTWVKSFWSVKVQHTM